MAPAIGGGKEDMAESDSHPVRLTQTAQPLRILCFGAGAIGTYIGGSLALAGHQVVFLERPDVAAILREKGLKLVLGGNEYRVTSPRLVESLSAAFKLHDSGFDAALVALKSFDTADFTETLHPYLNVLPPLLCLQNGVDNEDVLAQSVGAERVIPGTVTSAIGRLGVGGIMLERLRGVGVTDGYPESIRLVAALNESGLNASLYPDGRILKWSKMLTNLLANATSAILDMTPAQIYAHPGLVRLEIQQIKEALQVMARLGITPVDLPGTPVKLLVRGIQWLPAILLRPLLHKVIGGGRGGKMPSFHIDLHQGRGESEVGYLNGAVARHGAACGIATPINQQLTMILEDLTHGRLPLDTYRQAPQKLLAAIQAYPTQKS